jgi:hypothetical protein
MIKVPPGVTHRHREDPTPRMPDFMVDTTPRLVILGEDGDDATYILPSPWTSTYHEYFAIHVDAYETQQSLEKLGADEIITRYGVDPRTYLR